MINDPLSKWPKEILMRYGELQLPSLWDYLQVQEQQRLELSEIKKLLKPMKKKVDHIEEKVALFDQEIEYITTTIPTEGEEGLDEEERAQNPQTQYPAWEVEMMKQAAQLEQRQWEEAYLAMYETIRHLLLDQQELHKEVLHYFSISSRSPQSEKKSLFLFLKEKSRHIKNYLHQLQSHLYELGIEVIAPLPGDPFDEERHRVVETQSKERGARARKRSKLAITHLIHCGYIRSSTLIRRADVVVETL